MAERRHGDGPNPEQQQQQQQQMVPVRHGLLPYLVEATPGPGAAALRDARLPLCPGARLPPHFNPPWGARRPESDGLEVEEAVLLPVCTCGTTVGAYCAIEPQAGACACLARRERWPDGAGNRRDSGRRARAVAERRATVASFSVHDMEAQAEPLADSCAYGVPAAAVAATVDAFSGAGAPAAAAMAAAYASGVPPREMRAAAERLAAGGRRVAAALADAHALAAALAPEAYAAYGHSHPASPALAVAAAVADAEEEAFHLAEWALGGGFRYAPARAAADGVYSHARLRYGLGDLADAAFAAFEWPGGADAEARAEARAGAGTAAGQGVGAAASGGSGGGGTEHKAGAGGDEAWSDVTVGWAALERLSFAPFAAHALWVLAAELCVALGAAAAAAAPPPPCAARLAVVRLRAMAGRDLGERMDAAAAEAERLAGGMRALWRAWQGAKEEGFPTFSRRCATPMWEAMTDAQRAAAAAAGREAEEDVKGDAGGAADEADGEGDSDQAASLLELAAALGGMQGRPVSRER